VAHSCGIPSKARGGAAHGDLSGASWLGGGARAAADRLGDGNNLRRRRWHDFEAPRGVTGAIFIRGNYRREAQGLRN
jgi:hypothetical protein